MTKETALDIHTEVISVSGGSHGLRDEGLLESALSRPQNVFAYENATMARSERRNNEVLIHD